MKITATLEQYLFDGGLLKYLPYNSLLYKYKDSSDIEKILGFTNLELCERKEFLIVSYSLGILETKARLPISKCFVEVEVKLDERYLSSTVFLTREYLCRSYEFEKSDKVTAKHILFDQLIEVIKVPLPKVIFYILMDEMFGFGNYKDENGFLGYSLKIAA